MRCDLHDTVYVPFYKRVSYFYIPALFVITAVLLDVLMYNMMEWKFPSAYVFSLSLMLFIATVVALCRYKWLQALICSVLLGWQLTAAIWNIIVYNTLTEIFSWETLLTASMAINNAGANVGSTRLNLWFLLPIILLIAVFIVGVLLVMWFCRMPRHYRHRNRQAILCGILAVISFFSYTVAYSGLPNYHKGSENYVANLSNQKFLYDTFGNRVSTLRTFGSYSFYINNLLYLINGEAAMAKALNLQVEENLTPNKFALSEDEVLGEGYNLIMVLMETFEREAVNPITMPNLYEFMQQSCVEVNGYYSVERTCFTDYLGQTGINVMGKEWWCSYADVPMPQSLANIFNRSNYATQTFHDTNGSCYNRNTCFEPTLGFQKFNNYDTYETTRHTQYALNSDESLFKENLEKIAPTDQNFYSYVISVSTHAINSKYDFHDYHPDAVAYIEQPENWAQLTQWYPMLVSPNADKRQLALNYLAGTYSFDQGFGALLHHLKTTRGKDGKLLIETTALVLFGDHYYYANPGVLIETEEPSEMGNRCPLIVYNPRAKTVDPDTGKATTQAANAVQDKPAQCGETLYRFTSTMDIYPTVCSLFGVTTDQQLTYGRSIFDPTPSIGVGYLNGYTWGSNGYESATDSWHIWCTSDFKHYLGEKIPDEQFADVEKEVNRVYASIHLNMLLLQQNRFKQLDKAKAYHLRTTEPVA